MKQSQARPEVFQQKVTRLDRGHLHAKFHSGKYSIIFSITWLMSWLLISTQHSFLVVQLWYPLLLESTSMPASASSSLSSPASMHGSTSAAVIEEQPQTTAASTDIQMPPFHTIRIPALKPKAQGNSSTVRTDSLYLRVQAHPQIAESSAALSGPVDDRRRRGRQRNPKRRWGSQVRSGGLVFFWCRLPVHHTSGSLIADICAFCVTIALGICHIY